MKKIEVPVQVSLPMPVVLLGTTAEKRPNFMAVGWAARVNTTPPMVAVGLNKKHLTPAGIDECGSFSLNLPAAGLIEKVDYCGLVSGRNADKSALFTLFYGKLGNAPMIEECPVCLECRLVERHELPDHWLFVGEIVTVYADPAGLTDGRPDMRKIDPLILTMPDNSYWRLGDYAGKAWRIGKNLLPG